MVKVPSASVPFVDAVAVKLEGKVIFTWVIFAATKVSELFIVILYSVETSSTTFFEVGVTTCAARTKKIDIMIVSNEKSK